MKNNKDPFKPPDTLNPARNAIRAELAQLFMDFLRLVADGRQNMQHIRQSILTGGYVVKACC